MLPRYWHSKNKIYLLILFGLLVIGIILALLNTPIIISYAQVYLFMNGLKSIFNYILINLITDPSSQILVTISNLFGIPIFSFYYTNILPSLKIFETMLGYGLIMFSIINLALFKFDLSKVFPRIIDFHIITTINSLAGAIILIGLIFANMTIIGMCALYFGLISVYLVYIIPLK